MFTKPRKAIILRHGERLESKGIFGIEEIEGRISLADDKTSLTEENSLKDIHLTIVKYKGKLQREVITMCWCCVGR